jgi:solute carrier family 6 GABA transporter-like protein 1
VWLAELFVWFIVFICVFKGVKLTSKIVWITVPLPLFFVFIMVMQGLTLENSDEGIRMYLKGEVDGVAPDI